MANMPNPNLSVERLATTIEAVFVLDWARFPNLPQSLHRFPGVTEWWKTVQETRERDKRVLEKLIGALKTTTKSDVAMP